MTAIQELVQKTFESNPNPYPNSHPGANTEDLTLTLTLLSQPLKS
jgi:hypothetical protein